jgi:hypothetical protein
LFCRTSLRGRTGHAQEPQSLEAPAGLRRSAGARSRIVHSESVRPPSIGTLTPLM